MQLLSLLDIKMAKGSYSVMPIIQIWSWSLALCNGPKYIHVEQISVKNDLSILAHNLASTNYMRNKLTSTDFPVPHPWPRAVL